MTITVVGHSEIRHIKQNKLFYIYKSNDNSKFPIILSQPNSVTTLKKWIDYDVIPSTIYYYRVCAVDNKGHYSLPSIVVSGRTNTDDTPLRIKVDEIEKKRLNKKELEKQIEDNSKNAEVLRKRLDKIT